MWRKNTPGYGGKKHFVLVMAMMTVYTMLALWVIVACPKAQASPQSFLDAAHQQSYWNTNGDVGLLNAGYNICGLLDSGWTPAAMTGALGPFNYFPSEESTMGFVAMAIVHLCDFHSNQGFYESRPWYPSYAA